MTDLTVFAGARSVEPAARDSLTWDALCSEIAALAVEQSDAVDKRDLPAFGPYRLADGAKRSAAAVERMSDVVMLDVDSADLARLRARIASLGIAAIVHGTPSDDARAATRKVRVYVRADAEHEPADAGAMRDAVATLLEVDADPSTRNADRIGFVGRLAGTPPRYVERFDGAPLALATLPRASAPTRTAAPAGIDARPDAANDTARYAVLGALGPAADYDGRKHQTVGALGGVLRRAGWTADACADLVRVWIADDARDVEAGVRWAMRAWSKLPDEVSGRAALEACTGPLIAALVAEAALLPWRVRRDVPTAKPDRPAAPAEDYQPFAPMLRFVDLSEPPPPPDYVVAALDLAPGKVSALQGFANAGKTPFALLLATCVAAGVPMLGMQCEQRNVLYCDHETSPLTRERAYRVRVGLGLSEPPPLRLAEADPFSDAFLDVLRRAIEMYAIGMIVVDTYSSALPADAGAFNDSSFRAWATELGRLSNATGVLVVVLVHDSKERGRGLRGISGHGSLAGAMQAAISLEADEHDPNVVDVRCTRAARKGFAPFRVRWTDVDRADGEMQALVATREAPAAAPPEPAAKPVSARQAIEVRRAGEAIMRSAPKASNASRRELLALAGEGPTSSKRALARLVEAGLLDCTASEYRRTDAGREADASTIAAALGSTAGFHR